MPIYNKDGSVYKLRGPSPLAKDQIQWSKDKITLHNFKWKVSKTEDSPLKIENPIQAIEEFIPPSTIKEPEPVKPAVTESKDQKLKNVVIVHFQPTVIVEKKDDLYNEVYSKVQYGEKGMLEGVVADMNDFTMSLWTRLELTRGTVLYPSKYKDGRPFGDRRWWKISAQKSFETGFIYECIPSDYQPDFS